MKHHVPNALTLLRVALVPALVAACFVPGAAGAIAAFAIFAAAALTDALDGWAARRYATHSAFGAMLDPIADKLIVAAALVMLVADGRLGGIHVIPTIVILSREILVSGLREFLAGAQVAIPVTRIAKAKTALQMLAIGALLLAPAAEAALPGLTLTAIAGLWVAAALTVWTGAQYVRAGLPHLEGARP